MSRRGGFSLLPGGMWWKQSLAVTTHVLAEDPPSAHHCSTGAQSPRVGGV